MSDIVYTFLLAMTPIGELRLAIPIGLAVYNLNVILVFFVSVMGNLIPAFFLLIFLKRVSTYLSAKSVFFKKMFGWWENNARKKHLAKVQKYETIGLLLFVAIPFPLTGAWTGALLATIMNLPLKKSLPAVTAGVVIAGIVVSLLVIMGINTEKYLGWQILIIILLLTVFVALIYKFFKKAKHD